MALSRQVAWHADTGWHILGFPNGKNALHKNTDQDNSTQKYKD
jgi:hypothetical protein